MTYLNSQTNYDLNKDYRNRQEQDALNIHQARRAQQERKPGKAVNILRVISQIIVNLK